jgi:hypothetical protein
MTFAGEEGCDHDRLKHKHKTLLGPVAAVLNRLLRHDGNKIIEKEASW